MSNNLTGLTVSNTYGRLVQIVGGLYYDGFGNLLDLGGGTFSVGPQGATGSSGTSGTSGIDGATGSSGTSGTSGTDGTSGTSGIDGTSGTSGSNGIQGPTGSNGISVGAVYYFNQSQASDVSPYKVLTTVPDGVQQTLVVNMTGSQQNKLVSSFLTPQLGFVVIPAGTQRFHFHYLKQAENDLIEAYVTIQLANSSGTVIGPTISSGIAAVGWIDASTPDEVTTDITLPTTGIDPTNRMIVKLYLNNMNSSGNSTTWYTEGNSYYSFVITTVGVIAGTSGSSGTSGTSGSSGIKGATGSNGSSGTSGSSGLVGGIQINYNTNTIPTTLLAGYFYFNTPWTLLLGSSTYSFYISATDSNSNNINNEK